MGRVRVWYMTEEERLAYIAKHPINPDYAELEKRRNPAAFADIHDMTRKGAR